MQPTLCSRCKKRVAVVFISKLENGKTVNEGLCLKCAKDLGLPQVNDMMRRMGITDDDLEAINDEMMQAFGGAESMEGLIPQGDDEADGTRRTARPPPSPSSTASSATGRTPRSQRRRRAEPRLRQGAQGGQGPEGAQAQVPGQLLHQPHPAGPGGQAGQLVGREQEIERVVQILNRRQKNNPCLIGEPGVGKTAIAEGLAQRIANGEVPFKLRDKEVYLLDLTALVAGTQFRGQFESRMKGLIEEIRKCGNIILVIDEVHNIVGAGDAEGSMNAANILKPALSRGEIQVIGATTFTEYRKHIEKDTALERRFQPVTVNEPNMEDTMEILRGIAHYYEDYHGVKIPDGILPPGGAPQRAVYHRPLPAGQGHRPHRRGLLRSEPEGPEHLPAHGDPAGAGGLRQGAGAARDQTEEEPNFERLAEIKSKELQLQEELDAHHSQGRAPSSPWTTWPGSSSCGPRSPPARSGRRSSSA